MEDVRIVPPTGFAWLKDSKHGAKRPQKQTPNTKRFKRMLIYFNTDTQYAKFRGNPLLSSHKTTLKQQLER